MLRLLAFVLLALAIACAHTPPGPDPQAQFQIDNRATFPVTVALQPVGREAIPQRIGTVQPRSIRRLRSYGLPDLARTEARLVVWASREVYYSSPFVFAPGTVRRFRISGPEPLAIEFD